MNLPKQPEFSNTTQARRADRYRKVAERLVPHIANSFGQEIEALLDSLREDSEEPEAPLVEPEALDAAQHDLGAMRAEIARLRLIQMFLKDHLLNQLSGAGSEPRSIVHHEGTLTTIPVEPGQVDWKLFLARFTRECDPLFDAPVEHMRVVASDPRPNILGKPEAIAAITEFYWSKEPDWEARDDLTASQKEQYQQEWAAHLGVILREFETIYRDPNRSSHRLYLEQLPQNIPSDLVILELLDGLRHIFEAQFAAIHPETSEHEQDEHAEYSRVCDMEEHVLVAVDEVLDELTQS